jgi:hypothetical protein
MQACHSGTQSFAFLGRILMLRRVMTRIAQAVQFGSFQGNRSGTLSGSDQVEGSVNPRPVEIPARVVDGIEVVSLAQQPQEHCLQYVLSVGRIAGYSVCRPENPVVVGTEDVFDALRSVSHGDSLCSRLYCRNLHLQDSVCKEVTASGNGILTSR